MWQQTKDEQQLRQDRQERAVKEWRQRSDKERVQSRATTLTAKASPVYSTRHCTECVGSCVMINIPRISQNKLTI
jgi:heterodisulfide reductase subunit C